VAKEQDVDEPFSRTYTADKGRPFDMAGLAVIGFSGLDPNGIGGRFESEWLTGLNWNAWCF
jgi:hypothetical protein